MVCTRGCRLAVQLLQQKALQGLDAPPQRSVLRHVGQRVCGAAAALRLALSLGQRSESSPCLKIVCVDDVQKAGIAGRSGGVGWLFVKECGRTAPPTSPVLPLRGSAATPAAGCLPASISSLFATKRICFAQVSCIMLRLNSTTALRIAEFAAILARFSSRH